MTSQITVLIAVTSLSYDVSVYEYTKENKPLFRPPIFNQQAIFVSVISDSIFRLNKDDRGLPAVLSDWRFLGQTFFLSIVTCKNKVKTM